MKRLGSGLLFLALAWALTAAAARAPETVERLYSRGLYPTLAAALSCASALASLSLAELALFAASGALLWRLAVVLRSARSLGWGRAAGAVLADLILAAGVLVLAFVLLWGLNYRRMPFATSAGLDAAPAAASELRELTAFLVLKANELRQGLAEDTEGVMRTKGGPADALARTKAGFDAATARYPGLAGSCVRPKPLLLSEALSWLGLTGIYSPFTGEPNVNVAAPESEVPFSASHETAHQRGFAREDEANFVGYLACRFHPDADFRYSGTLAASVHASNALFAADRDAWADVEAGRSPAVKRDLDALRAWARRHEGLVARTSERVNDAYLRSQGQGEGVRSYGRMVDLLLAERRAERRFEQ